MEEICNKLIGVNEKNKTIARLNKTFIACRGWIQRGFSVVARPTFWTETFNFHGDFGHKVGIYHCNYPRTALNDLPFLEILHSTLIACNEYDVVFLQMVLVTFILYRKSRLDIAALFLSG